MFLFRFPIVFKNYRFVFEKRSFWKRHFKKTNFFKKRLFLTTIVSFSLFSRRFHNETIVFQKNENVNIPKYIYILFYDVFKKFATVIIIILKIHNCINKINKMVILGKEKESCFESKSRFPIPEISGYDCIYVYVSCSIYPG